MNIAHLQQQNLNSLCSPSFKVQFVFIFPLIYVVRFPPRTANLFASLWSVTQDTLISSNLKQSWNLWHPFIWIRSLTGVNKITWRATNGPWAEPRVRNPWYRDIAWKAWTLVAVNWLSTPASILGSREFKSRLSDGITWSFTVAFVGRFAQIPM